MSIQENTHTTLSRLRAFSEASTKSGDTLVGRENLSDNESTGSDTNSINTACHVANLAASFFACSSDSLFLDSQLEKELEGLPALEEVESSDEEVESSVDESTTPASDITTSGYSSFSPVNGSEYEYETFTPVDLSSSESPSKSSSTFSKISSKLSLLRSKSSLSIAHSSDGGSSSGRSSVSGTLSEVVSPKEVRRAKSDAENQSRRLKRAKSAKEVADRLNSMRSKRVSTGAESLSQAYALATDLTSVWQDRLNELNETYQDYQRQVQDLQDQINSSDNGLMNLKRKIQIRHLNSSIQKIQKEVKVGYSEAYRQAATQEAQKAMLQGLEVSKAYTLKLLFKDKFEDFAPLLPGQESIKYFTAEGIGKISLNQKLDDVLYKMKANQLSGFELDTELATSFATMQKDELLALIDSRDNLFINLITAECGYNSFAELKQSIVNDEFASFFELSNALIKFVACSKISIHASHLKSKLRCQKAAAILERYLQSQTQLKADQLEKVHSQSDFENLLKSFFDAKRKDTDGEVVIHNFVEQLLGHQFKDGFNSIDSITLAQFCITQLRLKEAELLEISGEDLKTKYESLYNHLVGQVSLSQGDHFLITSDKDAQYDFVLVCDSTGDDFVVHAKLRNLKLKGIFEKSKADANEPVDEFEGFRREVRQKLSGTNSQWREATYNPSSQKRAQRQMSLPSHMEVNPLHSLSEDSELV